MAPHAHGHSHDGGDGHGHSHDTGHGHSHAPKPVGKAPGLHMNLGALSKDAKARPLMMCAGACTAGVAFCVYAVSASHSLALHACMWLSIAAVLSLVSAMLSLATQRRHANTTYTYGAARVPVLSVFATTVLAQLAAVFLVKESCEHALDADHGGGHDHPSRLYVPAVLVAAGTQFAATYAVTNEPMQHVLRNAKNSCLQEHAADMSRTLCRYVPGLSGLLLPRLHSLGLLNVCVTTLCLLGHYAKTELGYATADPVTTLIVSACIVASMLPLTTYTGRILLQTAPPHQLAQLEKCVRECETLDGVLEVVETRFWQLDYNTMCGSVVVRCARDADEQSVLAHVTERLGSVVRHLTVQVATARDYATYTPSAVPAVPHPPAAAHGHSHAHGHGHSH